MKSIILIIGPGPLVGKSFVALKMGLKLGVKVGATGDIVMDAYLADNPGLTKKEVLANKEIHRAGLIKRGDSMCAKDLTCLAGALIERGCAIIDGIRRKEEFEAITKTYKCTTFWVEREGYPKTRDNTTVTKDMADFIIKNEEEK